MVSLIYVLYSMPGLMDSITSIGETTSEVSVLENTISETDISVDTLSGIAGSTSVSFNLNNDGSEKLWKYNDFEIFITYDADITGTKTRITEKSSFGNPTDFKIQSGRLSVPSGAGGDTATITEGIDFEKCKGNCFIKFVSTRHTSLGSETGGTNQNEDDWMFYISDDSGLTTSGGDITFTRHGTATTNHIFWEIWEYVGGSNGSNEMVVWDSDVCTFGAGSSTCNGSSVSGFSGNDAKIVVFVTGHANPDTGTANDQLCMITSAWNSGLDRPEFTRGTTGNDCDVSYTVVEFSGSNWSVERVSHTFTGADPQFQAVTDVGDRTRAFFHHQQRNIPGNSEALDERGATVELTDSTTLTYTISQGGAWGGNMNSETWVISNSETTVGQRMIVEHVHPPQRLTADLTEGAGPGNDVWNIAITPLSYSLSETAIAGMTSQSAGGGTSWPRGEINAELIDSSTVRLYQSDDGQPQEYTFQVVQFPRQAASQWKISNILNDGLDPNIINTDETAQIIASLTYPIFSGGNLAIVVSTDKGVTSSNSITIP